MRGKKVPKKMLRTEKNVCSFAQGQVSFELNEKLHRGREKDTHTHTRTVAETLVWDRITLALVSRVWQGNTEAATFTRKHRREQNAEQSAALICQLDQMPVKLPELFPYSHSAHMTSVYTHKHTHTRSRTHKNKQQHNKLSFFFFFLQKRRKSSALEPPVKNLMNLRGRRLQFPVSFADLFFFPPFPILSHSQLIKELSPVIIQTGAAKVP